MKNYTILIDRQAARKAIDYLEKLKAGINVGGHLRDRLKNLALDRLNAAELIELLMRTKHPRIFAEVEICGNGRDFGRNSQPPPQ